MERAFRRAAGDFGWRMLRDRGFGGGFMDELMLEVEAALVKTKVGGLKKVLVRSPSSLEPLDRLDERGSTFSKSSPS